jgi:hypothetical protein
MVGVHAQLISTRSLPTKYPINVGFGLGDPDLM